jgi:hypothetical protein
MGSLVSRAFPKPPSGLPLPNSNAGVNSQEYPQRPARSLSWPGEPHVSSTSTRDTTCGAVSRIRSATAATLELPSSVRQEWMFQCRTRSGPSAGISGKGVTSVGEGAQS